MLYRDGAPCAVPNGLPAMDTFASSETPYWLFGLHTVRAALANPRRTVRQVLATRNALERLGDVAGIEPELTDVRALGRLLGDVVHQGVAALVEPLPTVELEDLFAARLVLLLDHITDPHNVGAILRSAAAFRADAVVLTRHHSATETGVLAKSASGALDLVPVSVVTNLSRTVQALGEAGFTTVALDSEAAVPLVTLAQVERIAFVLGAEGKGVRKGVAAACAVNAAIEAPGALASLNVSNAAAIALYAAATRILAPRR